MGKRLFGFLSIERKLTLALLMVTLIPIIIISILINIYMKGILEQNFLDSTTKEMKKVDKYISMFYEKVEEDCKWLSTYPLIKNVDGTLTTHYDNPGNSNGKINHFSLKNDGMEREIYKTYLDYAETHPDTAYVYMATTYGGYIEWPSTQFPAHYEPRKQPWYQRAVENKGQVVRIEPYITVIDGNMSTSIVTTIENDAGDVIGVQGLDVDLKGLTALIKDITIGDSGYIVITDQEGKILAHPQNPDLIFHNIKEVIYNQEIEEMARYENVYKYIDQEEKECVANIYLSPKTGWQFIAIMDNDELMQSINQAQYVLITLACIFCILSMGVSVVFSSTFSSSIVKAANFAREIAQGNLSGRKLEITSKDEVGILANCLNEMRDNIKTMIEQITQVAVNLVDSSKEIAVSHEQRDLGAQVIKLNVNESRGKVKEYKGNNIQKELKPRVITEALKALKEAEEALRQSEERYRLLVEHAPDAIFIICEGKFVYANRATAKSLRVENLEDLIGKPYMDYIHPDCRETAKERIHNIIEYKNMVHHFESKDIRSDGVVIDIEGSVMPYNYQGKPAVQYVTRDITGRKKMDEEFLKASKLESIGILAGGIAHDFNNILTIILGNVSLGMMYAQSDEKIIERFSEIEKAVQQSRALTQQLLTFSKGGDPIKKVAFMENIIRDTVTLALSGSNVICEYSIAHDLLPVEVDEGQISQAINNLVINAIQAMPEGGRLRVSAKNITLGTEEYIPLQPGKYLKMVIKDEGIGIPEKYLQKIFDPFFTTKQTGSGIGLTSVYSVIKKHDGYITLKSEVGKGTTFYIYLPVSSKEYCMEQDKKDKVYYGKGKILVMDDEANIRDVAGQMLHQLGYEVVVAEDGAEAIEVYKTAKSSNQPFNVVILDLTIPGGMGGKVTVKELTNIDPEVKAIVSSGYSNDPVMAKYEEYGFKGVVAKPYEIEELSKVVYEVLNDPKI